jgi:hypothetical protein
VTTSCAGRYADHIVFPPACRYKEDLGNTVVNFARQVPDGLLVFFPSYTVMNACLEHWRRPGAGGCGVFVCAMKCKFRDVCDITLGSSP